MHDRVIACTIENGQEKYRQNFNSKNTIKEIKHSIKKNYCQSTDNNKMINLYYQGRELNKDDESLGHICNTDALDLVMVSITLTDSIIQDSQRIKGRVINKLSKSCSLHKGDKELNVCVTCGIAFCEQCSSEHKDHNTLNKKDLMSYSVELKEMKENIQKSFNNLGLNDTNQDSDIFKESREELTSNCDKLLENVVGIKKKMKCIYSDFKSVFDNIYPFLIEYKEKVDLLYEETQKETTIRIEKQFIDFYCKFMNMKSHSTKLNESFLVLKRKIDSFKDIINDFNTRIFEMTNIINEQFGVIKDYKLQNHDYDLTNMRSVNYLNNNTLNNYPNPENFHSKDSKSKSPNMDKKATSEMRLSHYSYVNTFGKMNLMMLLSPEKEKKALIKTMEKQYKERKSSPSSNMGTQKLSQMQLQKQSNIIEEKKTEEGGDNDMNLSTYFNINVGTQMLISFNVQSRQVSKITVNLSKTVIKKFEAYHSILNYKGKFYISGGYATSKMFYRYNSVSNDFIKLESMLTGHSYHNLLGVSNSIFAITGFKTDKVEKYNIEQNKWLPMPPLDTPRSWPSCFSIDEKYIFLFGGLSDNVDLSTIKVVERLDITSDKAKWETLDITYEKEFPFYLGILKLSNEKILLLGGKFDPKEDNIDICFSYSSEENKVQIENEYKLPFKDEFDGRLFFELGDGTFGQFSAIYSERFYIVNPNTKTIEVITSN